MLKVGSWEGWEDWAGAGGSAWQVWVLEGSGQDRDLEGEPGEPCYGVVAKAVFCEAGLLGVPVPSALFPGVRS